MKENFAKRYRVDAVPLFWKPFFYIYGYGLGFLYYLFFLAAHLLCRVQFHGLENLEKGENYIYCVWHENFTLYLCAILKHRRHIWLNDPSWYMKPIHVVIWLTGVERLVYGSTGNQGRQAADKLVEYLKAGYATVILPDGPAGPPKVMKKGALHMSLQSGVPIVPVHFKASKFFRLKTWEGKKIPLPFSKIDVFYSEPRQVTSENFDKVLREVEASL